MKSRMLFLTLVATTLSSAIPKPQEEHKNRVVEKDLSDKEHFEDEDHTEHNMEYDHEAFLGREDAQTFDDLSPEEAKQRLAIIYDKIDSNKDGTVTEDELKDWIKHVQNRYVWTDTERQWSEYEPKDDRLDWDSYKKRTYGFIEEEEEEDDKEDTYSYKDMMRRDEKRWKMADKDQDGLLSKEEFADFLHPEDAEHMRDVVIEETIEDIDQDKDGFISVEEYIADLNDFDQNDDEDDDDDDDHHDQSWIESEKNDFFTNKDKNGDGKLDLEEVAMWIMPDEYDYIGEEALHLIDEADANEDGVLTREEVLSKYDLFVGSQATDFGEALARHDEF